MHLYITIVVSLIALMGSTVAHPDAFDDNLYRHSLHEHAPYTGANPYSNAPLLKRHLDHDLQTRRADGIRDKKGGQRGFRVNDSTRTKCYICGTRCRPFGPKHPLCPYHMHMGVTCGPMADGEEPRNSPPSPHETGISIPAPHGHRGIHGSASEPELPERLT